MKVKTDADKIRAIWRALKEKEQCRTCQGGECPKSGNRYMTPEILPQSLRVYWDDCPRRKRELVIKRASKYLPARYAGMTFDDYEVTPDNEDALEKGLRFLEQSERGLYYHGGFGTGKTFLATLLGKEWLLRGKSVIFGDVPKLLDDIKRTFNDPAQNYQDQLDKYGKCDLLIMDDLGTGYMTAWNVGILYQIINERYNGRKPLIITSNYSPAGLSAKISKHDDVAGGRIVSRLKEMCVLSNMGNKDRRRGFDSD